MKHFIYPVLFAVFGIYILLFELSDYLYETAAMTPFYTTDIFIHDTINQCGGLLAFASSFLQSCFAIPELGASCMIIILIVIPYILKTLFPLDKRFELLYWLPSFAILLNYTQLGYMIYTLKSSAVAFTLPLGIVMALTLLWMFRLVSHIGGIFGRILKTIWIIAVSTLGYYALGCYALLSLLMAAFFLWKSPIKDSDRHMSYFYNILIAVSFSMPYIFYESGLLPLRTDAIYWIGLPDYHWTETEKKLWTPLVFSIIWTIVLSASPLFVSSSKNIKPETSRICSIITFICFVGAGYITYSHTFQDTNFTQILKMKRATDQGEWEEVLNIIRNTDSSAETYTPPTRLQVLFTRLALYKLGKSGDELFGYPEGDTPYNAPRSHQYLRLIGGRSLYYYYGKLNYSYRWCMEDMVEYGMRPDYLKYMLRCAVMNGEQELARKYADALRTNPFCQDFVKKYEDSLSESVKNEFAEISKLLNYESVLDGDGGLIEVYLLNSYAMMEGGTREMVDLSLLSCLILKDIDGFWPRFFRLLPTFPEGRIPRHYQEAALLFSQLKPGVDISQLPIDEEVHRRFEQLVEASTNNSQYGDEYNRSALRSSYGDTYWYYYFFTKGLKTN